LPGEAGRTTLRTTGLGRSKFLAAIADAQRTIHGRLVDLFRRRHAGGAVVPLLLAAAFLYGLLHALGPGHRKTILFSYFISRGGRWWHGIGSGIGLSAVHAGSAVLLVWGIHRVLRASFSTTMNSAGELIETVSYLAIAAMGIILLLHSLRELRAAQRGRNRAAGAPGAADTRTGASGVGNRTNLGLLVLSAGLVPCPGAATLLIFGITLNAVPLAAAAVITMSLGMAVTLSTVGVLTITMKQGLLSVLGGGKRGAVVATFLELIGAAVILMFGLLMGLPGLFGYI
jgi:ABC-type nickel/cobalt efflux system permease component RcnA